MRPPMEHFKTKEEALQQLLGSWTPQPEFETVPLEQAAGRVLAEDLSAKYSIPVVRASAMDGVAIRYAALENGGTSQWQLGREFVRADTGDDFPDDYDTVIPIEQVTIHPDKGLTIAPDMEVRPGMNVRPAGSQIGQGDTVGRKGTLLTALDLAAVGMGGYDQVKVVRRPRVAFVPTGSELVPVGSALARGQNFDTNTLMAAQMIREMGGEPVLRTITRDDPAQLREKLDEVLAASDIVILNAGTSKGEEDYCGRLLKESGQALFHGVAAVPGRPMSAAIINGKPVLNISGPALAAYYSLDWAVRPLVCAILGIPVPKRETAEVVLAEPLQCPPPMSLLCLLKLAVGTDGRLQGTPMAVRGPHAVNAGEMFASGFALYATTPGEPHHAAGETITVELIRNRSAIPMG